MKSLFTFMTILVVLLVMTSGFLFTLNNTQSIGLWLGTDLSARPLALWIIAAFILGGCLGLFLGAGIWRRLYHRFRFLQLQTKVQQQDRELDNLRQQLRHLQHRKQQE